MTTAALLALGQAALSQNWESEAENVLEQWPTPYAALHILGGSTGEEASKKESGSGQARLPAPAAAAAVAAAAGGRRGRRGRQGRQNVVAFPNISQSPPRKEEKTKLDCKTTKGRNSSSSNRGNSWQIRQIRSRGNAVPAHVAGIWPLRSGQGAAL